MENSFHEEHIDIMKELIAEKMATDAAKFGEAFSSSKEEFTEAATLFADIQFEDAAKLPNNIRITEIDFNILRKYDKSYGNGISSAESESTIRGKYDNSDPGAGASSAGAQSTRKIDGAT